ncbi:type IX secretion system PorP/SprF family membrane protein [Flavobacterium endophyticum]|uniref:Type IX secretion system PorP/SprF family membrane protein n=1 Tax=Flavobacterium endophyticum TaxID=1540163 RepID=A0A495MMA2_9FLAO|nr:PorP/SprF family type IX secretion system membrane protein [Flavobacterium endophyticum]RKS26515.1 type IX secretion system PorP/SprF family membrane protein [Flavobacterium endophyticum]
MIKNYLVLSFFIFSASFMKLSAQDAPVLTFNLPSQNNLKFNRFLQNPAFSFVREDNTYISLYHRNQWIQFDDSPKVYMLAYTGKFSDRSGLGFGLYQQNLGVIVSFGGIANYSYNVKLSEKMDLTFGFNLAYYNSGVDRNRTVTEEPDPILLAMRNNSLLSIKPGFNLSYGNIDFGIYAENFIDYDFKSSKLAKDYSDKTFSAHIMYSHEMSSLTDLFEGSSFRLAARGKVNQESDLGLSGSLLVDFPKFGWIQTGIDDFFGVGVGIGFHFTRRLSLGYTYERTIKEGLVNLGPTHEITMAFSFQDRLLAKKKVLTAKDTLDQIEAIDKKLASKKASKKGKPDFDKDLELEKLKLQMDDSNMHLLDMLMQEDSIETIRKAEFEQKVKNLMDYVKRENSAKEANAKPIVLRKSKPGKKIVPKTMEDLKDAENGYYIVSKSEDGSPIIERYESLPEALKSYEKKKASGKEKDIYIIHVDNPDELGLDENHKNADSNSKNKNDEQQKSTEGSVEDILKDEKAQREISAKTEEEIKEFYSKKTAKIRESPKKGNKLSVAGLETGYYIIANVFAEQENTEKFMRKMKSRGVETSYFINPKNNFRYVYLRKHSSWKEALVSYYSNADNTYFDPIWIMSINTN